LWAGEHGDGEGEGAKFWMRILAELRNRGVRDVLMVVCDGLNGLPDAIGQVFPQAVVQTCIVHLLRGSFRYASRKDWPALAKDLKPVYTAPSESAALDRFAEFTPFLVYDNEIRSVVCTINAVESINARIRKAVRARGHFPTEGAALKCVYLAVMSLDPTGTARKRWTNRWVKALNAFDMTFNGRVSAGRK
jgi:putative transposase